MVSFPIARIVSTSLISAALAHSISTNAVTDFSTSGNGGEIHALLNKTMSAMGGGKMLQDMRSMSYQAERSVNQRQSYHIVCSFLAVYIEAIR